MARQTKSRALERAELMVQKHKQTDRVLSEKEKLDAIKANLANLNRRR